MAVFCVCVCVLCSYVLLTKGNVAFKRKRVLMFGAQKRRSTNAALVCRSENATSHSMKP